LSGDPLYFVKRPVGISGNNVIYIRKPEQISEALAENGFELPDVIMLESEELSHGDWCRLENAMKPARAISGTSAIRVARSVKTAYEIGQFKLSAQYHTEVYNQIPSLYRPGMTDLEFSVAIEGAMRLNGCLGVVRVFGTSMEIFMGSILTGDNAAAPSPYDFALGGGGLHPSIPVGANGSLLKTGKTVMVDVGGNFTGYITDMTRVFAIGDLPEHVYKAHQVALEIQERIMQIAKPGVRAEDLYDEAVAIAARNGLSDCFMGAEQQAKFVGHGIGIELNELPVLSTRSNDILEEGMVFALEPKFIIAGVGAVGIENSFVVTASGIEKITLSDEKIIRL
jgi:Xaa-Pro aminopeptidase